MASSSHPLRNRLRIAIASCALTLFAIYVVIETSPLPAEPPIDPPGNYVPPTCNCGDPSLIDGISKYEDLDVFFDPRDAKGTTVVRSNGPCVRISGTLNPREKGGPYLELAAGVSLHVDLSAIELHELNEEPGLVLEGCLVRAWWPPHRVTKPGWSRESRRRAATRNNLQARGFGYVYSLAKCRRVIDAGDTQKGADWKRGRRG